MIYNLVQFLTVQLPQISFVVNGFSVDSPQDAISVSKEGGPPTPNYPRTEHSVQIFSRALDTVDAEKNASDVFNLLHNRFHLLLPEATVKGTVYQAIQTYQITALQEPGYLGNDDKHHEMFSFNLKIITK